MYIHLAEEKDIDLLFSYDKHVSKTELENGVRRQHIYMLEDNGSFIGWLRYNLFWDNTPFINMLYIRESYQRKGFGRQLITWWEKEMARQGFETLMTSTQSNEYGQHFYVKLGYETIGGFRLEGEGYEIIMAKTIDCKESKDIG